MSQNENGNAEDAGSVDATFDTKNNMAVAFSTVFHDELAWIRARRDLKPGADAKAQAETESVQDTKPAPRKTGEAGGDPPDPSKESQPDTEDSTEDCGKRGKSKRVFSERAVRLEARNLQLIGLALSGGGIRSATFCLGVLQSLAKCKYLKDIDYLSTVSGGGYIGAWLTAWAYRSKHGIQDVEKALTSRPFDESRPVECKTPCEPHAIEPHAIEFLREYSNYLTPQIGPLSIDTLAAAATYFRNFLNHFVLVALIFMTLFAFVRVAGVFFHYSGWPWIVYVALAILVLAILIIAWHLDVLGETTSKPDGQGEPRGRGVPAAVPPLILISAWLTAAWLWNSRGSLDSMPVDFIWRTSLGYTLTWPLAWILVRVARGPRKVTAESWAWVLQNLERKKTATSDRAGSVKQKKEIRFLAVFLTSIPAGLIGGYLLLLVGVWFNSWTPESWPAGRYSDPLDPPAGFQGAWNAVTFGPVLVLLIGGATIAVHIGLAGRAFGAEAHEWWSRLIGSVTKGMILVGGISLLAIQGPYAVDLLLDYGAAKFAASGWGVVSLGGFYVARQAETLGKAPNFIKRLIIRATPYLFITGLLILFAWLAREGLGYLSTEPAFEEARHWLLERCIPVLPRISGLEHDPLLLGIEWLAVAALAVLTFGWSWRIGINRFSLSALYKARLVRCYLGASNEKRDNTTYSGFDRSDDQFTLGQLSIRSGAGGRLEPPAGPYHILNTTLNLTKSDKLAWQRRKGASFILSPLYCGYHFVADSTAAKNGTCVLGKGGTEKDQLLADHGYVASAEFVGEIGGLSLGDAMAVSGAAVSPAMGYHSTAAWTFLLATFNLRLGRWVGNPRKRETLAHSGPKTGLFYLIIELLGWANDRSSYVYLSDGGHFENLGLYELIRRECRYIIVCDGEQDPDQTFSGLGNAIEKCRADFGVNIEIDVEQVRADPATGLSAWHCAVGRICYSDVDKSAPDGILVYLKSSLTGDEPEDLIRYKKENPAFPHHSTADQWFDETQFESYRMLGEHIGKEVLRSVPRAEDRQSFETFFVKLRERWYPPSTAAKRGVAGHMTALNGLIRNLRSDPNLAYLDSQFYPNSVGRLGDEHGFMKEADDYWLPRFMKRTDDYWLPKNQAQLRAGFYLCKEMISFMEGVFNDLHLEEEFNHPDSRGWMNLFSRWWWSRMFRFTWAVTKSAYSPRFQTFCEQHLSFAKGVITLGRRAGQEALQISADALVPQLRGTRNAKNDAFWEGRESTYGINYFERWLITNFVAAHRADCELMPLCLEIADDPAEDNASFRVNVGFAILQDNVGSAATAKGDGKPAPTKKLIYYRIQSHLRNMGLGRRGLFALLEEREGSLALDLDLNSIPKDDYEVTPPDVKTQFTQLFFSAETEYEQRQKLKDGNVAPKQP